MPLLRLLILAMIALWLTLAIVATALGDATANQTGVIIANVWIVALVVYSKE